MSTTAKSGPESKITPELVTRVAALVAKGIPIRRALQPEFVSFDAYKKHLQRHPELAAIQATAKVKFLDVTIDSIVKKNGLMLRWLLERRHATDFSPDQEGDDIFESESAPAPKTETKPQIQTIAGVPEDLLNQTRKIVQNA